MNAAVFYLDLKVRSGEYFHGGLLIHREWSKLHDCVACTFPFPDPIRRSAVAVSQRGRRGSLNTFLLLPIFRLKRCWLFTLLSFLSI